MHEPHWLIQELAGEAVWTGVSLAAIVAWKYRRYLVDKLRTRPQDIIVHLPPLTLRAESPPVRISAVSQRLSSYAVRVGEESTRRSSYRIEAPTPSLAKRLEELAAWYLHVS